MDDSADESDNVGGDQPFENAHTPAGHDHAPAATFLQRNGLTLVDSEPDESDGLTSPLPQPPRKTKRRIISDDDEDSQDSQMAATEDQGDDRKEERQDDGDDDTSSDAICGQAEEDIVGSLLNSDRPDSPIIL